MSRQSAALKHSNNSDHFLVPPEVETSFVTIIDSILAASDLNTISEKRIRKGLQDAVEYDITPQKVTSCPSPFILLHD